MKKIKELSLTDNYMWTTHCDNWAICSAKANFFYPGEHICKYPMTMKLGAWRSWSLLEMAWHLSTNVTTSNIIHIKGIHHVLHIAMKMFQVDLSLAIIFKVEKQQPDQPILHKPMRISLFVDFKGMLRPKQLLKEQLPQKFWILPPMNWGWQQ